MKALKHYIQVLEKYFLDVGTSGNYNSETSMRMKMLYIITSFAIINLFVLGIDSFLKNEIFLGTLDHTALLILLLSLYYLKKSENYFLATYIGISVIGMLFLFLLVTGGDNNSGHLWLFTFPLFTFFLLGSKKGAVVNLVMLMMTILFFQFGYLIKGSVTYSVGFIFRFIASYLVILVYSFTFEELKKRTQKSLIKQKENLEITILELQVRKLELKKLKDELEFKVEERTKQLSNEIEARKKDQELIAESEHRFRSLFENSPIGMYVTAPDGKIIMINDALVEMLGYSSKEKLLSFNADSQDNYIDFDREKFKEEMETKGKVIGLKSAWKKRNGKPIYIKENAVAYRDKSGKLLYYQGTLEDITKHHEFNEALIKAKENAEKSDQLKSQFLAQISHEIRTPVNSILSFTNLLYEEISDLGNQDFLESFDMIERGGRRLIRTVDLVLNMAELQTKSYKPNIQELNLEEEILSSILRDYKHDAKMKGLELKFSNTSKSSGYVLGDEYTLIQIFVNLIDNAIKFTHDGEISVNMYDGENTLLVDVKDTGIGISEEYKKNLFKPFCQEEMGYTRSFDGNGLGLSVVKKCCEINNAYLSFQSKKNRGTTFTVKFQMNGADG
ncbi:autoinducer 2 sensor kinase/phosphatase LuxQ [bacterium BMS3Abin04]|nr:autoinducer 2 sensor kinase/phosphatase LuxQ [bacterium BMS3Abin04]